MLNNQVSDPAKQAIIDDLLKELPVNTAVAVDLPSENRVYTLEDPDSPITLRPMTFEDEKALVSAGKAQDPVNLILQRCLSNINVHDLLSMDKLYLLMKLREISYGDDYNTVLLCSHCGAENPTTVKLSQLNVNPVPDDFEDPITVLLPTLNKEAKVRLPRVRDERLMTNPEDALNQLWRFVVELAGHTDKSVIAPVIDKLPLVDVRTILNAIKSDYGVDTKVKFSCNSCGGASIVDLPIDANFFNVN